MTTTGRRRRLRDWPTDLGIAVVGVAAAALTFTTLSGLGETVGFREHILGVVHQALLLPVTIDAAGVVAARVWLHGTASPDAVRFARRLTWACILASVTGNAGQHVMVEFGITPPWWVVVGVTAIPPAMLGAVVHLGHLVRRPGASPGPAAQPDPDPAGDHHTADHTQSQSTAGQARGAVLAIERTGGPDRPGELTVRTLEHAPTTPDDQRPQPETATGPTSGHNGNQTAEPDPLLGEVRQWAAHRSEPVSQRAIRTQFRVGGDRAKRLLAQLDRLGHPAEPTALPAAAGATDHPTPTPDSDCVNNAALTH